MSELTFLVIEDGDDGFLMFDNGVALHVAFRNAATWSDNANGLASAQLLTKRIKTAKVMRVRCALEEVA